jgi:hypothetical protein
VASDAKLLRLDREVGLKENHPKLFEEAKKYEKIDPETGARYTWSEAESLEELSQPERIEEIKRRQALTVEKTKAKPNRPLLEILGQDDGDSDELPCSFCHTYPARTHPKFHQSRALSSSTMARHRAKQLSLAHGTLPSRSCLGFFKWEITEFRLHRSSCLKTLHACSCRSHP